MLVLIHCCHLSGGELQFCAATKHLKTGASHRSCPSLRSNDLLCTSDELGWMSPRSGSSQATRTGRGHLLSPQGSPLCPVLSVRGLPAFILPQCFCFNFPPSTHIHNSVGTSLQTKTGLHVQPKS